MTLEECQEHYPGSVRAVYLYESIPFLRASLDYLRDAKVETPEGFVRDQCDRMRVRVERKEHLADEQLAQLEHPDFLKYVRARFGCM